MESLLPTPTRELGSQEQRRASLPVVTRSKWSLSPEPSSSPPHPCIMGASSIFIKKPAASVAQGCPSSQTAVQPGVEEGGVQGHSL